MNRLQDKTAVVIGGASGIGLATAELFARGRGPGCYRLQESGEG